MKKCLIIGGNGFIGKNLVLQLLKNNYEVVVFDITTPGNKDSLFNHNNVQFIEGDVNHTAYLCEQTKGIEYVVWLIHTTVPATSMYDMEFDLTSNIVPLIKYLQYSNEKKSIEKFIYVSSGGTVYGNPNVNTPITEIFTKNPISSYGLTKLVAEEYITFITKNSNIQTFILRPSNVYGRYQNLKKPQGLIGHTFKALLNNQPITIFGDGSITRDFVHVNDLADAIISCFNESISKSFPLILNIGSGQPSTINEIISNISLVTKKSVKIIRKPERDFDCRYNVLDISSAKKKIDWFPKIDIQCGLKDVWYWISEYAKK